MTRRAGGPARSPGRFRPAALYPIVDQRGDPGPARALARAVLAAGAPWLQLRAKDVPAGEVLALARELVALAAAHGARLIVNDRLDVALASGAAGVHLGQDDLPPAAARRVAGEALVIGVSTHDAAEARAAFASGADYVGFGPMFPTASKADARAQRTLDALRAVRAAVALPVVAIGGITAERAAAALDAGADAVAMIRALEDAADPEALARRVLALRPRA